MGGKGLTPLPSDKASLAVEERDTVSPDVGEARNDHGCKVEDGHPRVGLVSSVPGRHEVDTAWEEAAYYQPYSEGRLTF
jgi:hypothetical protein